MFETMAFLTTVSLIAVFVLLYRLDRAGRREDEAGVPPESGSSRQ